jgi:hypothetical protein
VHLQLFSASDRCHHHAHPTTNKGTDVEVDIEQQVNTSEHDVDFEFEFARKNFAPGLPLSLIVRASKLDGAPLVTLPGATAPFTPTIEVEFEYDYQRQENAAASVTVVGQKVKEGEWTVLLEVPSTAMFVRVAVANADGNGNQAQLSKAVWSPSNTFLRASTTSSTPTATGTMAITVQSAINKARTQASLLAEQESLAQSEQYSAQGQSWYDDQIERSKAMIAVYKDVMHGARF